MKCVNDAETNKTLIKNAKKKHIQIEASSTDLKIHFGLWTEESRFSFDINSLFLFNCSTNCAFSSLYFYYTFFLYFGTNVGWNVPPPHHICFYLNKICWIWTGVQLFLFILNLYWYSSEIRCSEIFTFWLSGKDIIGLST